MKGFGFLPAFTRSQRMGLIVLVFLIVLMQLLIFKMEVIFPSKTLVYQVPQNLQKQYDSLRLVAIEKQKTKIYPFNPNYISDYKAYFLGMSLDETDRIQAFRQQGKYINSKLQFKQITGISDSLYSILEPYIKLTNYHKNKKDFNYRSGYFSSFDINKATATDLQNINGIGEVLSVRIVKYRNAIGDFSSKEQINKVYGLKPEVAQRVWQKFHLSKAKNNIPKKVFSTTDINLATTDDLKNIYGIGEKLANRIVKYRKSIGGFAIKEQLNDVYGLKPEVIVLVWKQFTLDHPNMNIKKINLNNANIKELSKNPNISYQLAKKIVSYRTLNGAFRTFEDLLQVDDFPKTRLKQIVLFLKLKE